MIADNELKTLFDQESKEHLEALESGVLALEKTPEQPELHETVMREAHSLKGAARMLGLNDIEHLSHRLESLFRHQIDHQSTFDSSLAPQLLSAIDALKQLCKNAVEDTGVTVDMDRLLNSLSPESLSAGVPVIETESNSIESAKQPGPPVSSDILQLSEQDKTDTQRSELMDPPPFESTDKYRITTLRVDPEKLDYLMDQVGELMVVQKRIHRSGHQLSLLNDQLLQFSESIRRLKAITSRPSSREQQVELNNHWVRLEHDLQELLRSFNQSATDQLADHNRLAGVVSRLDENMRDVRMLPLSVLFNQYHRMVHDIAAELNKEVELVVEGADTQADKKLLEEMKDVVMHLLRNALTHGIETPDERKKAGKSLPAKLTLSATHSVSNVVISISDDGRGLDREKIGQKAVEMGLISSQALSELAPKEIDRLILKSGLTTQEMITDISGRGVGMDVVRNNIDHVKGEIDILSEPGNGTTFNLQLPIGFATTELILVKAGDATVGIPLEAVDALQMIQPSRVYDLGGKPTFNFNDEPVSLVMFTPLLRLGHTRDLPDNSDFSCIIISHQGQSLGLLVDEIMGEQEVIIKPLSELIGGILELSGVGILSSGAIAPVISPSGIISAFHGDASMPVEGAKPLQNERSKRVLLVEDSMITRIQEKRIIEAAGYEVTMAVDGMDGWNQLQQGQFDAVVSDILMPKMNGFELTKKIRSESRFADLPVILVTTLSSNDDRRQGLQAGASGYITKSGFDEGNLVAVLNRLTGANVDVE